MAIVIKKRISFEFLGDEYKNGYITFKSMPVSEYEGYLAELDKTKEDQQASLKLLLATLVKYFVEGKFPNDKGELEVFTAEEINQFDGPTLLNVFAEFSGQQLPKVPEKK